jgi:phosphoribosylanthranilate isomerase
MRVKICGITREADALLAMELGAWAIGFVFWPGSPRRIEPGRAQEIVRRVPPLAMPVGVFVDQPMEYVQAVADEVGLGAVQLHGAESAESAGALRQPVIKAIGVREGCEAEVLAWPSGGLVLLDAHDPTRRGGTGKAVDWDLASRLAAQRLVVLAGGLRPDNVRQAVERVRPAAIDVSSGVECEPGLKDPDRLRALFAALEGVEAAP